MHKPTHVLAFVYDLLIAGVKLGEDLDAEIRNTVPDDVIEAYEKDGYTQECYLTHEELDEEELWKEYLFYESNVNGYLPEDDQGKSYWYAYANRD